MLDMNLSQEKLNEIANLNISFDKNSDFINKKFNHLTVLGKGPNYISPGGHSSSQWWCICDCEEHNIVLVRRSNLTGGNTKSCGCQNTQARRKNIQKACVSNRLDLTNQQFGELTALRPTENRNNGSVVWECQCSCGNLHYVAANNLMAHRVESCGCITDSKGVRKIKQILDNNNISYITEQTFESCKFEDSKQMARFDFYINNEFLLEYDGIQHFREQDTNYFKDTLAQRQAHDQYKNDWCKNNLIPLKRIPYTDYQTLTLEDIMGDKYLI